MARRRGSVLRDERANQSRRSRQRPARARRLLPAIAEPLEARQLLTAFHWVGGSAGDFNVASNWADTNNQPGIPGPNDDITISGGTTVTVTGSTSVNQVTADSSETIDVTGGTFTINNTGSASSTLGTLDVASSAGFSVAAGTASFFGSGTSTIAGTVTAAAGSTIAMDFSGPLNLNAGASISGSGLYLIDDDSTTLATNVTVANLGLEGGSLAGAGSLNITGTLDWTGGAMSGTGTTTIASGATLNMNTGTSTTLVLDGWTIDNAGTTNWTGTGFVNMGGPFNNEAGGTFVAAAPSTLRAYGASVAFSNAGTFDVNPGSGQTVAIGIATFNNAGTVSVQSGTFLVLNNGTDSGAVDVRTGTTLDFGSTNGTISYTIAPGATWDGAGTLAISGQFADIIVNTALTVTDLSISTGTLDGTGDVTVTDTLAWTGGAMAGSGTTTIPSGATLNMTTGASATLTLINRTIDNAGTTNWTGMGIVNMGGPFNNEAGGTFVAAAPSGLRAYGSSVAFSNVGTIEVNPGSGQTVSIGIATFNNMGTVNIQSGTFQILNNGTDSGAVDVPTGTALEFGSTNGTISYTIAPGATWHGDGTLAIAGQFADVLIDTALTVPSLSLSAGAVDGTANFTVTGTIDWTGGTMLGAGTTIIPAGATVNLSGDPGETVQRTLSNSGTINWTAGTLYFTGTAVINNAGVFDIGNVASTADHGIQINNTGTIAKTAGTGTTTFILGVLNNTGTVEVDSGALDFVNGAVTQVSGSTLTGGTWNVLNGASLAFPTSVAITANQASVTLSGATAPIAQLAPLSSNSGSLTFKQGATMTTAAGFENSGTLYLGPASDFSVQGSLTLDPTSTVIVELAGVPSSGQFGMLKATGAASLGGTLGLALEGSFVPATTDSFPILTYASQSGTFATIDRISSGAGRLLAVTINTSDVVVTRSSGLADLAVTEVTAPASATVGQQVTITYEVENDGPDSTGAANWQDSVYLATSPALSRAAILVGRVSQSGPLADGQSYTGMIKTVLPGTMSARYHVIVVADSQDILVDTNRANNAAASTSTTAVSVPALAAGTPTSGTIAAGQAEFKQITVAAGSAVTITVSSAAGAAGLYVRFQGLPSLSNYDEFAENSSSPTQTITIPGTQAGTYDILV
jgi:hypothetical protein